VNPYGGREALWAVRAASRPYEGATTL
jgi:hypothetical protein